jgi:hypothetical protein
MRKWYGGLLWGRGINAGALGVVVTGILSANVFSKKNIHRRASNRRPPVGRAAVVTTGLLGHAQPAPLGYLTNSA